MLTDQDEALKIVEQAKDKFGVNVPDMDPKELFLLIKHTFTVGFAEGFKGGQQFEAHFHHPDRG